MRLNCIRTAYDGKQWTEVHTVKVEYHGDNLNSWWIKLSPGVTGYESAPVESILKDDKRGWNANAGSQNYDRLWVPEAEMDRLRDMLRLIEPLLTTQK